MNVNYGKKAPPSAAGKHKVTTRAAHARVARVHVSTWMFFTIDAIMAVVSYGSLPLRLRCKIVRNIELSLTSSSSYPSPHKGRCVNDKYRRQKQATTQPPGQAERRDRNKRQLDSQYKRQMRQKQTTTQPPVQTTETQDRTNDN